MRRPAAGLTVGLTSLLLTACGGSSGSVSATTSFSTSGSSPVPATNSSSGGAVPATTSSEGSSAATAATTTSPTATHSSSSAGPTSSTSSASESLSSSSTRSAGRAGNSDVRVPVTFAIGAGGSLSPPQVAVPKHFDLALSVASQDGRSHTFQLRTPHPYAATVGPGAPFRALLTGTPPGSYAITVDGRVAGMLIVGVAPGP